MGEAYRLVGSGPRKLLGKPTWDTERKINLGGSFEKINLGGGFGNEGASEGIDLGGGFGSQHRCHRAASSETVPRLVEIEI